jgi:hypothetical protein
MLDICSRVAADIVHHHHHHHHQQQQQHPLQQQQQHQQRHHQQQQQQQQVSQALSRSKLSSTTMRASSGSGRDGPDGFTNFESDLDADRAPNASLRKHASLVPPVPSPQAVPVRVDALLAAFPLPPPPLVDGSLLPLYPDSYSSAASAVTNKGRPHPLYTQLLDGSLLPDSCNSQNYDSYSSAAPLVTNKGRAHAAASVSPNKGRAHAAKEGQMAQVLEQRTRAGKQLEDGNKTGKLLEDGVETDKERELLENVQQLRAGMSLYQVCKWYNSLVSCRDRR